MILGMKHIFLVALSIAFWEASSAMSNKSKEAHGDSFPNPMPKTTVRVLNLLNKGLTLTIHCKSGNDDLGVHVVQNQGQYQWHFHRNYLGTTLFFCGITWSDGSIVYDIYRTNRDYRRCSTQCDWIVTNDALLGFTQEPREQDITVKWLARRH